MVFILLAVFALGILFVVKPGFTGFVVFEEYENQTACEDANYTWEILTNESCTTITDCIECVEDCLNEGEVCEEDCVEEYTEVLCVEGCVSEEDCNEDPECVVCEEDCIEEYTEVLCVEGCVSEEDLCEDDCQETCQNCSEIIIGGQCVGDVCASSHLDLCNETNCETDGGGYWYNGACNTEECAPETCESLGKECGTWDDSCEGTFDCGNCDSGYSCIDGVCEEEETTSDEETTEESDNQIPLITGEIAKTVCSSNWQCGNWSECIDNVQSRECTDINACGSDEEKPVESQSCQPPETCSDGIENQDEKGIDCGGVCEVKCSFFTIVGNVINVPIDSSKQFIRNNKIISFSILGIILLMVGWIIYVKLFLKKKRIFFFLEKKKKISPSFGA